MMQRTEFFCRVNLLHAAVFAFVLLRGPLYVPQERNVALLFKAPMDSWEDVTWHNLDCSCSIYFSPPVVWCACGLLPPPALWCGVGWVVPPCMFGSAGGVWQTHAHDDIDDDDDDNHDHHYHNHLSVSLVGRRVSSAHVPADDYRFIDRGGTIFATVVNWGNRNRVQWVNCHRDRACQGTWST